MKSAIYLKLFSRKQNKFVVFPPQDHKAQGNHLTFVFSTIQSMLRLFLCPTLFWQGSAMMSLFPPHFSFCGEKSMKQIMQYITPVL
jgi:hypothetical protein